MKNTSRKEIWITFTVFADDLSRLNITHQQLLDEAGLSGTWREVACDDKEGNREIIKFEMVTAVTYTHRPSDNINDIVSSIKTSLWRTVSIIPPFRKYYLYLSQNRTSVLHQLLSIYAIFYYLGSVTRYKPHHFDSISATEYGPFILEMITNLPDQFLYLMASEFSGQEVARAAVI